MSDKKDKQDKPAKGKGLLKLLAVGVLVAGAAGGTVFGLMTAGVIQLAGANAAEAGPQFVLKGEEDPYAPAAPKGGESKDNVVYGEGGTKYRTAYFSFAEDFTSNLRNSDGLIQVSLAASTRRDGRVLMWLDEHQLAIRSRILVELADTPEEKVMTSAGKKDLQKRLTDAVNAVLVEQEGFGGVDNVYFRTFIVQ
ncbi:flagellar basal body-associated FliL family protein [Pelagerythrobacter aerophilus]|uniref:Flagellar protein FliL n=1 Tax=Pelagerythrobacter aerophilus TaxID=2306995 RepID=A0A418NGJ2_9SPHN|nr:flagellar basal body-associated FliL family protein [Pelagerythrobacter aerophilus]RIV77106.1 flagellar basal body-associated protein FliL [Pelagerythrobacter aerophilus]